MLTIDAQIWIYYFDIKAKEHNNVVKWLIGDNEDGILFNEQILLSSIIPLEVAHNLFKLKIKNKDLDEEQVEEMLLSLISLENCHLIDVDQFLILQSIKILKKNVSLGIGGRDALILATMEHSNVKTIASHDKNILTLKRLKRIDPVFHPPLILEVGEDLNFPDFKDMVSNLLEKS